MEKGSIVEHWTPGVIHNFSIFHGHDFMCKFMQLFGASVSPSLKERCGHRKSLISQINLEFNGSTYFRGHCISKRTFVPGNISFHLIKQKWGFFFDKHVNCGSSWEAYQLSLTLYFKFPINECWFCPLASALKKKAHSQTNRKWDLSDGPYTNWSGALDTILLLTECTPCSCADKVA